MVGATHFGKSRSQTWNTYFQRRKYTSQFRKYENNLPKKKTFQDQSDQWHWTAACKWMHGSTFLVYSRTPDKTKRASTNPNRFVWNKWKSHLMNSDKIFSNSFESDKFGRRWNKERYQQWAHCHRRVLARRRNCSVQRFKYSVQVWWRTGDEHMVAVAREIPRKIGHECGKQVQNTNTSVSWRFWPDGSVAMGPGICQTHAIVGLHRPEV